MVKNVDISIYRNRTGTGNKFNLIMRMTVPSNFLYLTVKELNLIKRMHSVNWNIFELVASLSRLSFPVLNLDCN